MSDTPAGLQIPVPDPPWPHTGVHVTPGTQSYDPLGAVRAVSVSYADALLPWAVGLACRG